MAFQFSLRALLRLRQTYEKRERMRLTVLNVAYGRLQQEYQESGEQRMLVFEQLEQQLQKGISGSELRAASTSLQHSNDRRRQLTGQMKDLELQVRKQTETYLESQTKRKILDSLRERELRAFELDENRREQQRIDDLFVQRQRFQTHG